MVVTKIMYGNWGSLVGTLPEVMGALRDQQVTETQLIAVNYDGTNWVAIYHR